LKAARKQVEAMGDPREEQPPRKAGPGGRGSGLLRERQHRLEQAPWRKCKKVRGGQAVRRIKRQARAK